MLNVYFPLNHETVKSGVMVTVIQGGGPLDRKEDKTSPSMPKNKKKYPSLSLICFPNPHIYDLHHLTQIVTM